MTAVSELTALLNNWDEFKSVLNFTKAYSYYIPDSVPVPIDKNEVYVSDVTEVPNGYGSNRFKYRVTTVQLHLLYGKQNKVNQDEIEDMISSFLYQNDYLELPSSGRYRDPETGQTTKVINFIKERGIYNG